MAITVFDGGSLSPEAVNNITKEKCEELEKVFDALDENSEVYRFNNRISRDFKASEVLRIPPSTSLSARRTGNFPWRRIHSINDAADGSTTTQSTFLSPMSVQSER